jgi:hypothetical protein
MRKLAIITTAAILSVGSLGSTATQAAVGHSIDAAIAAINPIEQAGCYRLGETGYHWYRFCLGPYFLYPHQRVCRHGYCYYR